MAVLALPSWAAKQAAVCRDDHRPDQRHGDYRRAVVQAGAAAIGILVAIRPTSTTVKPSSMSGLSMWCHMGPVLPTLVIRNVTIGPLTIGYNAGDTDNYSWYKLGETTSSSPELAKISFIPFRHASE